LQKSPLEALKSISPGGKRMSSLGRRHVPHEDEDDRRNGDENGQDGNAGQLKKIQELYAVCC
jgi:hypothetical protein